MNNAFVDTNLREVELKWTDDGKGIIDDDAITAFEWGHCHSFAYEMNAETGWPIIAIGHGPYGPTSPSHFMCYDPKIDDFVDIQGRGAMERNEDWIRGLVQRFTPHQYPTNYRPMNRTLAKPFVLTVLRNVETLPTKRYRNYIKWEQYMGPTPMVLDKPNML